MDWTDIVLAGMTRGFKLADADIAGLTAAANNVATELTTDPTKLHSYALVGFDPTASVECPVFDAVEHHILGHWKSFRHSFSDRPQLLLRAVLVLGVLQATTDTKIAGALYVTLRDVLPRLADQSEHGLHSQVLGYLKPRHAELATLLWTAIPGFAPGDIRVPPRFQIGIDKDAQRELADQISKAIKVFNYDDSGGTTQAFSVKNAGAVGAAIAESVTQMLTTAANQINTNVPKYYRSAEEYHEGIQGILRDAVIKERQQNLLWWLNAKFSTARQISYRTLGPFDGAVQMALDFEALTPEVAPDEVEAVLIEAIHVTYPDAALVEHPLEATLRTIETPIPLDGAPPQCRRSLLEALANQPDRFSINVAATMGLNANLTITPVQLATWLLHSLQARSLIS